MEVQKLKDKYNIRLGTKNRIQQEVDNKKSQLLNLEGTLKNLRAGQAVVQEVAERTQQELEYSISQLITECLQSVFDENIEMKVQFTQRRGNTEADLLLKGENGTLYRPKDSDGAGVVDIMAFGLRMVLYTLKQSETNTHLRPLFIMDEPFKKVNDPTRTMHVKTAEMIKSIVDELGIQLILVTLLPEMEAVADNVQYVEKKGNQSYVKYGTG